MAPGCVHEEIQQPARKRSRRRVLAGVVRSGVLLAASCRRPAREELRPTAESLSGHVSMYFWDTDPLASLRVRAMEPFTRKFPRASLEVVNVPNAAGYFGVYLDKITSMLAAGSGPDVFIIPDFDLLSYWDRDLLLDIEPFVRRDKYDLSDFPPGAIASYRRQGTGLYGLPDNITTYALFYNLDLLERFGVPPLPSDAADRTWTWEAMRDRGLRLTRRELEPSVIGLQPGYGINEVTAYVRSAGGDFLSKDGSEVVLHEAPALEAFQYLADLRNTHRVVPLPEDLRGIGVAELFLQGRLAIWETGAWQIARFRQQAQFRWDVGFRPYGRAGRTDHLFAYPLVIWSGTRVRDLAWEALKFFEDEALPVIVQEGGLQGTKMNAHQRKYFVDPSKPPRNAEVFVTSVERFGRTPPMIRNFPEVQRAWQEEIAPIWSGQRSAREGVLAFKRRVDPLLKPSSPGR